MEDETRSAVLTELGREYRGMSPKRTSGEKWEEVRNRMETWNERVERAQRITERF